MTRAKRHLVSVPIPIRLRINDFHYEIQCVVGDSSTVIHGGSYLKKWLHWLDENADVRYAGID